MRHVDDDEARELTDRLLLDFHASGVDIGSPEPSRFVHDYSGEVRLMDDDGAETCIGCFEAIVVDVEGAIREGQSVADVFDVSQSTLRTYEALYGYPRFTPRTAVRNLLGRWPAPNPNLLQIERLVLWQAYQGRGIGLHVINGLIQRLGMGVGVVAMLPFPLQFEGASDGADREVLRAALTNFEVSERAAFRKLRSHYGRLGFVRVPRTDMMVRRPYPA